MQKASSINPAEMQCNHVNNDASRTKMGMMSFWDSKGAEHVRPPTGRSLTSGVRQVSGVLCHQPPRTSLLYHCSCPCHVSPSHRSPLCCCTSQPAPLLYNPSSKLQTKLCSPLPYLMSMLIKQSSKVIISAITIGYENCT